MGDTPLWAWLTFAGAMAVMLLVDLFAHRGEHGTSRRAAIVWSLVWIGAGLGFGLFVWFVRGGTASGEYFAAYLIEKSLSVDNLFVFLLVFQTLRIPHDDEHRVLIWGILGALVFRAIFIALGITALERIEWMIYVFAAILLWAAWRVFREDPREHKESKIVEWLAMHLPVTGKLHGHRFLVREEGRLVATPLLLALVALETTDVMFAVDSIPAALSITRDPFVVYSSNAFAILGLRALYTVLSEMVAKLAYLHYGLAFVLAFAAVKIFIGETFHFPPWLSIAIIVVAMGVAILFSLRKRASERPKEADVPRPRDEAPA